ncbi:hypothetical protein DXA26_11560 [Bacteroides fragilis]|nr:hypothetical protein DXB33_07155 [Bacteroides fragilis]RGO61942.1 hypothetical protein DXB09_08600 [Bacteroides fragilis]RGY74150.1 hypothetical protein DXA26_11560 [Bacteroides fragilis]
MMTNLRFFSATSKFFKGRQLSICHSVFSNHSKTLYFRPTGRLIKKTALTMRTGSSAAMFSPILCGKRTVWFGM